MHLNVTLFWGIIHSSVLLFIWAAQTYLVQWGAQCTLCPALGLEEGNICSTFVEHGWAQPVQGDYSNLHLQNCWHNFKMPCLSLPNLEWGNTIWCRSSLCLTSYYTASRWSYFMACHRARLLVAATLDSDYRAQKDRHGLLPQPELQQPLPFFPSLPWLSSSLSFFQMIETPNLPQVNHVMFLCNFFLFYLPSMLASLYSLPQSSLLAGGTFLLKYFFFSPSFFFLNG